MKKSVMKAGLAAVTAMLLITGCSGGNGAAGNAANPTATQTQQATQAPQDTATNGTEIPEQRPKEIALENAKVAESDVTAMRVKKEMDDGVWRYDVEFYVQNKEYDYEINAADGTILSVDYDVEDDFAGQANSAKVSQEQASKMALDRVPGASQSNLTIHFEMDDGRAMYEGKIVYNEREYEFEIDANTGEIVGWEEESIYD